VITKESFLLFLSSSIPNVYLGHRSMISLLEHLLHEPGGDPARGPIDQSAPEAGPDPIERASDDRVLP